MKITKDSIIGEVVAQDYRAAAVFRRHQIDYCCNGNRSLENACACTKVTTNILLPELELECKPHTGLLPDFTSWSAGLLASYIENQHHRFAKKKIAEILAGLEKICRVHGQYHPELFQVKEIFCDTVGELTIHMKKEETLLFPVIRMQSELEANPDNKWLPDNTNFEVQLAMLKEDHDQEGERFRKIAAITHQYTAPPDGCNTYRATMQMLRDFEEDLHLHIHLENNILFPKALRLFSLPAQQ